MEAGILILPSYCLFLSHYKILCTQMPFSGMLDAW